MFFLIILFNIQILFQFHEHPVLRNLLNQTARNGFVFQRTHLSYPTLILTQAFAVGFAL